MITRNAIVKFISQKQGGAFLTYRPNVIQSQQNFPRQTIAISRVARNDYRESYGSPSRGSSFRMLRVLFTRKKSFIITVNWPAGLRSWEFVPHSSPTCLSVEWPVRPWLKLAGTRTSSLISYPFAAVGCESRAYIPLATCSYCRSRHGTQLRATRM